MIRRKALEGLDKGRKKKQRNEEREEGRNIGTKEEGHM